MNRFDRGLKAQKVLPYQKTMPQHTCMSAQQAVGAGTACTVSNYKVKHVTVSIDTISAGGRIVVKNLMSDAEAQPTWTAASSSTNQVTTVNGKHLPDRGNVDGNTGIVFTAGNARARTVYINEDGGNFLNCRVTTYSTSITASVKSVINAWNG